MLKKVAFLLISFSLIADIRAQTGNYYLNNLPPALYGASDQNWGIVQDEWNRLYVANNNGVLMNDGKWWKHIPLTNGSRAFSLAKNEKNIIYVGGIGTFGKLSTLPSGDIEYVPLSDKLPENKTDFSVVWKIICVNDDVFFCANEKIFLLQDGNLSSINPENEEGFHTFFKAGNHFITRERGIGLKFYKDQKLLFINGSENFANERVDFIVPYKNEFRIGSRGLGVFAMKPIANTDSFTITKINVPTSAWMKEKELYCGARLNEQSYALGSLQDGVMIVDSAFNLIKKIAYKNGLQDDAVKDIYLDHTGNIWLSLNKGISMIEYNTPATKWGSINGIRGSVEAVCKYNGILFIATDKGVLHLNEADNQFYPIGLNEESFDLIATKNGVLAATANGLYLIQKEVKLLLPEPSMYKLYADPDEKNTIYIGTSNSFLVCDFSYGQIKILDKHINLGGDVRSIVSDRKGNIFFSVNTQGVFVLNKKNRKLTQTGIKNGLPDLVENMIFTYNEVPFIGAGDGIYSIKDPSVPTYEKQKQFNPFKEPVQVYRAYQVNDEIWIQSTRAEKNKSKIDQIITLQPGKSGFIIDNKMLKRIRDVNAKQFYRDSTHVYIATNEGLICYNIDAGPLKAKFHTLISKVSLKNDTNDLKINITPEAINETIDIPYSKNDINFYPAASDFYNANELEFSYYLEGKEDLFGPWTKTSKINYTNLHEGEYTFHLKARNIIGEEGKEITFAFTINPPFYRTAVAYLFYILIFILITYFIVKLNTKRLRELNLKLEGIIKERTKTIVEQKEEIEQKNREITDSINYAKRIQEAILPPVKEINTQWKDLFVFYQPKDIVSGDFYWYKKINNDEMLIAAADCTGHGIPGGFMSMICSDNMHEAAKQSSSPDEILFYVNNAIKKTLHQEENESSAKDGMELALIKINFETGQLSYAGANRPLWIVRKNKGQLEEIKPTKAGIASNTQLNTTYQLHTIQIQKGDAIYISTDGYADQFGGDKGKKYMTANFKSFLEAIADKPTEEQQELIDKNINTYKKNYEQVDDLLVIGIKYS